MDRASPLNAFIRAVFFCFERRALVTTAAPYGLDSKRITSLRGHDEVPDPDSDPGERQVMRRRKREWTAIVPAEDRAFWDMVGACVRSRPVGAG